MSLAILFHFLYAKHVSDINISIIRSLRLFCCITTLVVLFLVQCALEFRCGWVGVVSVLQAEAQLVFQSSIRIQIQPNHTENPTHIELRTIRQYNVLEYRCCWVGVVSVLQAEASACNTDTTPTQPHRNSNTHRTKNNTTNVVIQHNSRKLLMMDILMSETC